MNVHRVEALLAAPAGRRFIAEVMGVSFPWLLDALELSYPSNAARLSSVSSTWPRRRRTAGVRRGAVSEITPEQVTTAVNRLRMDPDRAEPVDIGSSAALMEALTHAIFGFGFWGDEKEYDHLLEAALDELRPMAEALESSPATAWWWDALPRHDQRYADRTVGDGNGPPRGDQVFVRLAGAVQELRRDDAERKRHLLPGDAPNTASGAWWSIPLPALLTSRPLPPVPALDLVCAEDPGDDRAMVWSLRISQTARVFEVRQPSDWAQLVGMAPLDVTISRFGDWQRWTERDGPFYLPDWSTIAQHYDGVHVTVAGYLATRSVPVPVAGGYSVLAGWDPDVTLWLRDVAESIEPVGEWSGPFSFVTGGTT